MMCYNHKLDLVTTCINTHIKFDLFDPFLRTVWTSSRRKMFENSLYLLHITLANKNQLSVN